MTDDPTVALADRVATMLERRADDLVATWIEWLRERVSTRTIRSLPDQALRNHIPPVLIAIASYVRTPLELVRAELLGHLQLHGKLRWEQGYDIEEVLAEFDGLAALVTEAVKDELADVGEHVDASSVVEILVRVTTGLRSIGHVTVSIYRETESNHRREVARQLDDFARSISHELRGPLNTISLGTDMLADPDPSAGADQHERHIAIIRRSLARLTDLVDNIQILALAEGAMSRGDTALLSEVVTRAREDLRPLAARRSVDIRLPREAVPPVRVPSMVTQLALTNVLSNSIKYTDPDESERYAAVSATVHERADAAPLCEIEVRDNGIGIPDDLKTSVFHRGVRAHPETAQGTGLGLFIVRRLLEQLGGEVTLESESGVGTAVRLVVPVLEDTISAPSPSDMHRGELVAITNDIGDASAPDD